MLIDATTRQTLRCRPRRLELQPLLVSLPGLCLLILMFSPVTYTGVLSQDFNIMSAVLGVLAAKTTALIALAGLLNIVSFR